MTTAFAVDDGYTELVHDLRSPLAAIEAAAHAVLATDGQNPVVHRLITMIAEQARCAQSVVDSALATSSGTGSFEVGPVLAAVACRSGVRWSAPVHVEGEGLAATVLGDPLQVNRAVGNLIDNAFQHSRCGSVRLVAERRNTWLVIRVVGGQDGAPSAPAQPSHGLGLQSVRRIMQACDGRYATTTRDGARVDELRLRLDEAPIRLVLE